MSQQVNAEDHQRSVRIRAAILAEGDRLRRAWPILQHQNAIGLGILLFALTGMVGFAWGYCTGHIAWYVSVPATAMLASLTHELEHDLIHYMYFRHKRWMHHVMMLLVWVARPNTISPWARRKLHLDHHKFSGMSNDLEERALTNGEPWSLHRLFMLLDTNWAVAARLHQFPDRRFAVLLVMKGMLANFPFATAFWAAWHAFLMYWGLTLGAQLLGLEMPWPQWVLEHIEWLHTAVVAWVAPNILRMFSLHFISSNMHYYGDIENGNIVQQCQVLNHWIFWPLHLFCFNFGSTHAIHHFVVRDPFYIRQMTAPRAHAVMRANGVRFNDLGTFRRANRFHWQSSTTS